MAGQSGAPSGGASRTDAGMGTPAPTCKIPNEIMILDEDADGGVDPTCQNVPRKVIANNCIGGICHDSNGPPAGGVDLMSPCVADRLVNVKSRCQDLLLIDTAHPAQSLMFDKLNSAKAKCGETMPFAGHLPPDELSCINAWLNAVIRAAK
jgi:hypothetical protein